MTILGLSQLKMESNSRLQRRRALRSTAPWSPPDLYTLTSGCQGWTDRVDGQSGGQARLKRLEQRRVIATR